MRGWVERKVRDLPPARRMRTALALKTIERFGGDGRARVLDAGCEFGALAVPLARRRPSWTVVGVDIRPDALASARRAAAEQGVHNLHVACADLTRPLRPAFFDVVAAMECLLEIPEDAVAVGCMSDALRPGGLFVAHVPDAAWSPVLRRSEGTWRRQVRHGYTPSAVEEMLGGAGLQVLGLTPTTCNTLQLAQEVRDLTKASSLKARAALYPAMVAAQRMEAAGLTWGPNRGWFVEAVKS